MSELPKVHYTIHPTGSPISRAKEKFRGAEAWGATEGCFLLVNLKTDLGVELITQNFFWKGHGKPNKFENLYIRSSSEKI